MKDRDFLMWVVGSDLDRFSMERLKAICLTIPEDQDTTIPFSEQAEFCVGDNVKVKSTFTPESLSRGMSLGKIVEIVGNPDCLGKYKVKFFNKDTECVFRGWYRKEQLTLL